MRRIKPFLCCVAMVLAGCGDPRITQVQRRLMVMEQDLPKMSGRHHMLVEIHGSPWPGADRSEVAGTIRMPDGPSKNLRFVLVKPGESRLGGEDRLVLHFNPTGGPDSVKDCHARSELPSDPPSTSGFTVNVTVCRGDEWMLRAVMESGANDKDWLAYYQAFQAVLGKMFPGE